MSRSRTSATLAVALTAGALAVVPFSPAAAQVATTVDIQVLGINDFHGRLVPPVAARAATDTSPARPSQGGAAFVAGAVDAYTAENPNTIFVSAGDNIGASPFVSAVQQDEPTLEVLNAMGLAVSAVGNHEFDRGYEDLATRVDDLADFPILGANVEGETPDMASSFVETIAGVDVGFVGVVTEETASLVSPDGIRGISFSDPVAAANEAAAALTDGNATNGEADVLVLLAHEGAATSSVDEVDCAALATADDAFGDIVRGIDSAYAAILGGHTHLEVDCEVPGLGRTVPLQVLEAQSYGTAMDVLNLTVDTATGDVTAASGEVVKITSDAFTADAEVQALVDTAVAEAKEVGRQPIGTITQDITRAFTADSEEDRGSESLLGNFIADVQLAATRAPGLGGAEIAFMNPGGLRADLLFESSEDGEGDGVVTYAELAEVQPFANGVITMTLTGQQVKDVLEEQFQPDGSSRPFLALGVSEGFRYEIDATEPRGSRISSITLNGSPIDLAGEYRVAVNSFLASGGDNFGTLADGTDRLDGGFNDLNLLVEYVQENSPITPSLADRAVPAGTEPALLLERLAGADRFGTAAEVALETFGAAPEALLGNGSAPADALAGSYLAGVRSAPVLLTARDTLPAVTLEALRRLGTETVTILGGTDVVGAGVVSALEAEGLTVARIGAADRYATAAAVATAEGPTAVGEIDGLRTAVLANGLSPVDALVAGAPAYAAGLPVLLTEAGTLSSSAAAALESLDVEQVLVVGGTTVVSAKVVTDLEALGLTVERLAGADRRLTALAVAEYAKANLGFVDTLVVLARGDDPADALVGGPRAGRDGAPILLTESISALGTVNRDYLAAGCDTLFDGRVLGGVAAVSAAVVDAAVAASECTQD